METSARSHSHRHVRDLLSRNGLSPEKRLGQHFLCSPGLPRAIVELSGIDAACDVLEIGPGLGALTLELSRAAQGVVAVEADRALIPLLEDTLKGCANVTVIHGDILKTDLAALVGEHFTDCQTQPREKVVCANLPYNITTPVLTLLLDSGLFGSITVMVQSEVARRLCAEAGTKEYGAFTVYAGVRAESEILLDVPPECFVPPPKVNSCVVKLTRRAYPLGHPEAFSRVVRAAFSQRRKTLPNALAGFCGLTKNEIAEAVESCGVPPMARGETLDIAAFDRLTCRIWERCHHKEIGG